MNVKVTITITPEELNKFVLIALKADGHPLPDNTDLTVLIAKAVEPPAVSSPAETAGGAPGSQPGVTPVQPSEPVTVPAPMPAPVTVPSAEGTALTTTATIFGLNYDGSIDTADNGEGAFTDPATGKPYNTRDKSLVGCAIPIPILWETIGSKDYDGVSHGKYTVTVRSLLTGKSLSGVKIVDLGPGIDGKLIPGHLFDQTYGLAIALGHHDNAKVTYSIIGPNGALPVKGL